MQINMSHAGAIATGLLATVLSMGEAAQAFSLTGLSVYSANGAGGFSGQVQWDTVKGDPNRFWDLQVTKGGLNSDFLDWPRQGFNYRLTPGEHTFTLFGDARSYFNITPSYGLNLFFDGETVDPDISAVVNLTYDTANIQRRFIPALGAIANLEGNFRPGAGTLAAQNQALVVTLTAFQWLSSTAQQQDRVNTILPKPNGDNDMVGTFTLNVVDTTERPETDVPEPSSWLALATILGLLGRYRRQNA